MHDAPTRIPYFHVSAIALKKLPTPAVIFLTYALFHLIYQARIHFLADIAQLLTIRMYQYETH